mmetsp:Transcript_26334/g.73629  ORF Transcript_26334/g.73629 Transcript_26334/m.73629 type:complete len:222 (+) Transcript_26334:578-1243(+)
MCKGGVFSIDSAEEGRSCGSVSQVTAGSKLIVRATTREWVFLKVVVPQDALHVLVGTYASLVPAEDLGTYIELVAERRTSFFRHYVLTDATLSFRIHGLVVRRPVTVTQDSRLVLEIEVARELLPNRQNALREGSARSELGVVYDHPHVVVRSAVVHAEGSHPIRARLGQVARSHRPNPTRQRARAHGLEECSIPIWKRGFHDDQVFDLIEIVRAGQDSWV